MAICFSKIFSFAVTYQSLFQNIYLIISHQCSKLPFYHLSDDLSFYEWFFSYFILINFYKDLY